MLKFRYSVEEYKTTGLLAQILLTNIRNRPIFFFHYGSVFTGLSSFPDSYNIILSVVPLHPE
jgi:hypothetical protein